MHDRQREFLECHLVFSQRPLRANGVLLSENRTASTTRYAQSKTLTALHRVSHFKSGAAHLGHVCSPERLNFGSASVSEMRVARRVPVSSELRTYLRRVEVDHSEQWRAPAQLLAATQSGRLLGSATLLLPLTGTADDLQEQKIDATTCRKRSSKQFPGRVHCVDAVSRQLSVSFRTQQRWRQVRAGRQRISSRHQLQATGTSHARAPCLPVRHAGWRTTLLQRCVSNRRMRG